MTDGARRAEAVVFLQRALLGMVTPELRGVTVRVGENLVHSRMIYEHEPTEDDRELVAEVETEVIAAYLPEVDVAVVAEGTAPPVRPELRPDERWVYRRREPE